MNQKLAKKAVQALLYEVVTLPKPGLVDPASHGAHPDMDIYTFIDSSLSLEAYFIQAEDLGDNFTGKPEVMFEQLREMGIQAEKAMYTATKKINTHKGAIFSLGIFVCASAYADKHQADVFDVIKEMTKGIVEHDLGQIKTAKTAGEIEYQKYGKTGIRGEAEAGYPVIRNVALPFFKQTSGSLRGRLLDTLMKIASVAEDSNFIKRAGSFDKLLDLKKWSQKFLELGGANNAEAMAYLTELDDLFTQKNYSLGGCADLLIVTIFLALKEELI